MERGCDPHSSVYLVKRRSIAIQRGNAASLVAPLGQDPLGVEFLNKLEYSPLYSHKSRNIVSFLNIVVEPQ